MNSLKGFFNTVYYSSNLEDNSWGSCAENIANKCRAPVQWVASALSILKFRIAFI